MNNALKYQQLKTLRRTLHRNIFWAKNQILGQVIAFVHTMTFYQVVKRSADILLTSCGLLILWPVGLLIALGIKLTSPGPIFYSQIRIGRYGKPFKFYKFRSMYIDADKRRQQLTSFNQSQDGIIFKMRHDPRITPFGRFLRQSSMDELPQLLNVLQGDMSLVGPRPPLPQEVAEYTVDQQKRLDIRPGITCLWQVSGRSELPFKMQMILDRQYIANRSLFQDWVILCKTVPAILSGKGAW